MPVNVTEESVIRQKALRRDIVNMAAKSGHVGVALSCVDIIATLYFDVMNTSLTDPTHLKDYFILSKGHGCMALYAVLARAGYFDPAILASYGTDGSILAEHPIAGAVPGIECATGSLGHGLAIAAGIAKGLKIQGLKAKVYVLLGDGECNEGSIWEAAGLAVSEELDNLVAIVDRNGLQACGRCDEIGKGIDLADCWRAFGWEVNLTDGHDCIGLADAFMHSNSTGRPRVVLCNTVKGKGIDFMENNLEWHYRPVRGHDKVEALKRLADA